MTAQVTASFETMLKYVTKDMNTVQGGLINQQRKEWQKTHRVVYPIQIFAQKGWQ